MEGTDRELGYFVGNNQAISIRVDRSEKGDAIEIQETVQRISDRLALTLPEGAQIELIRARADYISGRLKILLENGLSGLGLVLILLFLFLNARTAFWVAAGIPTAMLAALAMIQPLISSYSGRKLLASRVGLASLFVCISSC